MTTAPAGTLLAERFVLTPPQLAAAMSLAGLTPSAHSALPADTPPADARAVLAATGLLDAAGAVRAELRAALTVAAAPHRMLTAVTNRAGRPAWTEATFLQGATSGGPAVAQSLHANETDLALLPTPAQALVTLDELLAVTDLPARPGDAALSLDLAAFAAVLATADFLQEQRLEARLARQSRPLPAVSVAAAEAQLARGLASNDTRWAVTAARAVCPANLPEATGRLAGGLERLDALGLVMRQAGAFAPTARGLALFDDLQEIVNSAGLLLAEAQDDRRTSIAHVTLFRCTTAIWFAGWRGLSATGGEIDLFSATETGALNVLEGLLSPTA